MKYYILVFLFFTQLHFAQQKFNGIILDAETRTPIEYVNISLEISEKNNETGTISNEIGEFQVNETNSNLLISHLNYETLKISYSNLTKEILLKPKKYELEEIIVSNEDPRDYLMKIIKNSTIKLNKNTEFKAYGREVVKINNQISKFSDALVNYYIVKGNGKSKVTLEQNRAFKNKATEKLENEKNLNDLNSVFEINEYVKVAYDFKNITNLLKNKEYQFERKIKKSGTEEYEVVEIIPNENSKKYLSKGYIVIDLKTNTILEFKIHSSENHAKNSEIKNILIAKLRLNKYLYWTKFKYVNNEYILNYNKKMIDAYIKFGSKINDNLEFMSDIFVYDYKSNVQIPEISYKKRTIFEAGTNIKDNYWNEHNVFPLSESEQLFLNKAAKN